MIISTYLHIARVITNFRVRLIKCTMENGSWSHILQSRHTTLIPQQVLWRHHNHGFAEVTMDLSPQTMEVVCRSGTVHNLPVRSLNLGAFIFSHGWDVVRILLNHLEVALHTTGGMLSALTIVSMG